MLIHLLLLRMKLKVIPRKGYFVLGCAVFLTMVAVILYSATLPMGK